MLKTTNTIYNMKRIEQLADEIGRDNQISITRIMEISTEVSELQIKLQDVLMIFK